MVVAVPQHRMIMPSNICTQRLILQTAADDHDYLKKPLKEYMVDSALKFTEESARDVEAATRDQSKSPVWHRERKWRITASSNGLQAALTSAVYFTVVLSTRSTKECGLQLTEKMKSRSVFFRNVNMKLCQAECIEDSYIFASCRRSSEESKKTEKTSRSSIHPETHSSPLHCVISIPPQRPGTCQGCKSYCHRDGGTLIVKSGLVEHQRCGQPVGGHREVVELLVSTGANVSLVDRFGINILHSACLGGDVEVVKYVLSQNMVDINGRVRCGRTAVMLAAANGHKDVVEMFVDKGATVSFVDETGNNILHCACRRGDMEAVKYILSQKMVDVNSYGPRKKTPLMVAAEHGHKEVVELLVTHGADLSLSVKGRDDILHIACNRGQFDVVKYLLSLNSVDINSRGYKKRTPVMAAAEHGHKEVVELLVTHGADLSLSVKGRDDILHIACKSGQFDVVKYLLSLNSVDINRRGYNKRTPVMTAGERGKKKIVELLVKHGADLSHRAPLGGNILNLACRGGKIEVVKYVLSLNTVDINTRGIKKRTPVMIAAAHGHKEVVELLVKNEADLSLRDSNGKNVIELGP
ncbi:ankyrin repeat domain-containing protein 50-like [Haliotis rubra]|uniref:ankyrin repeat domain-containing protein 50-like n=1 Tax=Haliotis rubra TaxID=36100 RepID=UPI001EE609CC|nr:ankyrin repeat domain-containing protein 50-like [Haliotis rubra]